MTDVFTAPKLIAFDYDPNLDFEEDDFELIAYNLTEKTGKLEICYAADYSSLASASLLPTLGYNDQSANVDLEEGSYTFIWWTFIPAHSL